MIARKKFRYKMNKFLFYYYPNSKTVVKVTLEAVDTENLVKQTILNMNLQTITRYVFNIIKHKLVPEFKGYSIVIGYVTLSLNYVLRI